MYFETTEICKFAAGVTGAGNSISTGQMSFNNFQQDFKVFKIFFISSYNLEFAVTSQDNSLNVEIVNLNLQINW